MNIPSLGIRADKGSPFPHNYKSDILVVKQSSLHGFGAMFYILWGSRWGVAELGELQLGSPARTGNLVARIGLLRLLRAFIGLA